MTYHEWALLHATIFGLHSEAESTMLLSWVEDVFKLKAITPDELAEATRWLAANNPPRFRTDHLRLLQEVVQLKRHAAINAARLQAEQSADQGRCTDCGGTGRVIVPHLDNDSKPYFYTQAVLCHCALGNWFRSQQGNHAEQMTLAEYARIRPHWRDEMRQHAEALRREANAFSHARQNDKLFGAILEKASRHPPRPA